MYQINLKQINAFRALMATRSITKAAKLLNLSQPAVSRLIKQFELQSGVTLFVRDRGRLNPTDAADEIFLDIETAYEKLDRIPLTLEKHRNSHRTTIRVAATTPAAYGLMPDAIASFRGTHGDINVSLDVIMRREVHDWLETNEFDLVVISAPTPYPSELTTLMQLPGCPCILPLGHPRAAQEIVQADDLRGDPFIAMTAQSVLRRHIDAAFQRRGASPPIHVQAQSSFLACELVERGVGVSVVDPLTALRFLGRVEIRPFVPQIAYHLSFIYPRDRPTKPQVEALVHCIHAAAQTLLARAGDELAAPYCRPDGGLVPSSVS